MIPSSLMNSLINAVTITLVAIITSVENVEAGVSCHTLKLTNADVSPDGITREGILVNGNLMTTLITGQKGDQFQVTVENRLTSAETRKSTSIHWHGLFQRGSSWADGPAFVTQCPIAPGNDFTYVFTPIDEAGTFWYHSHLDAQYCDGLRGPLVIYDPNDLHITLYDVDNEDTVITLADWYESPSQLITGVPTPRATLINGLGRTATTSTAPLSVFTVTSGKRYRFRLVSLSCDPNYVFSIESHDMTIIEADGNSVDPVTVSSLQIFVGQRYSFVLAANQPIGNYWIRANPNLPPTGFADNINSAILRYTTAPAVEPAGEGHQDDVNRLREENLHSAVNPGAPGERNTNGADVDLIVNIGFANGMFNIDGTSYVPPSVPTLLQILSGALSVSDLRPSGSYIALPAHKVVQLSFPIVAGEGSAIGGPHPIHLHGHAFDVIRSAGSALYNYANPVRRDVVAIGAPGDNVTIRFVTDNAGPWYLHCHIEWHLRAGLGVIFAEDFDGIPSGPPPPPEWEKLCDIYNALAPGDQ